MGSIDKAETLLVLCKYDFTLARSIAEEAASLFHCNMKFFKSIYGKFDKDANKVIEYLRKFKNHQPRNAETTHCKAASKILQSFRGNGAEADIFLEKFRNNPGEAQTFLKKFVNDGEEASSFLSSFDNDIERTNIFLSNFYGNWKNGSEYLRKFTNIAEGETFLQKFADGNEANKYLKKFKNLIEASEFLKKFDENGSKANELIREFNGSPDCASNFINSFDNPKEALEHLEKTKQECDEKTDNSCGDNCKWIFDEKTKMLLVRGSGKMRDYERKLFSASTIPWSSKREQIENVVLSEGIMTIGQRTFHSCSLTSITIPSSVTTIGKNAFSGCCSLETINVSENNQHFASADGILFTKNMETLVCYPAGKKESNFTVPNSATTIGKRAFSGCSSLTSVVIPSSITTIELDAFSDCSSLISGTIGTINWKLDKETGEMTFFGKGKMESFYSYPWEGTKYSIKKVTISEGITTVGESAFYECSSLTSITIPNSVTTIGEYAFCSCSSLGSIIIPDSVTTIGFCAFWSCHSLTTATLPKKFESQKDIIFFACPNLKTINWK